MFAWLKNWLALQISGVIDSGQSHRRRRESRTGSRQMRGAEAPVGWTDDVGRSRLRCYEIAGAGSAFESPEAPQLFVGMRRKKGKQDRPVHGQEAYSAPQVLFGSPLLIRRHVSCGSSMDLRGMGKKIFNPQFQFSHEPHNFLRYAAFRVFFSCFVGFLLDY